MNPRIVYDVVMVVLHAFVSFSYIVFTELFDRLLDDEG